MNRQVSLVSFPLLLILPLLACGGGGDGDGPAPAGAVDVDVGGAHGTFALTYTLASTEFHLPPNASMELDSCTLGERCEIELQWMEHGREAHAEIDLTSDSGFWWSDLIRVYDDTSATGGWVEFPGTYLYSSLGEAWSGEIALVPRHSVFDRFSSSIHPR